MLVVGGKDGLAGQDPQGADIQFAGSGCVSGRQKGFGKVVETDGEDGVVLAVFSFANIQCPA
jgi:hypothetical protein